MVGSLINTTEVKIMKLNRILSALALSGLLASSVAMSATNDDYKPYAGEFQRYTQTSGKFVGSYIANWHTPSSVESINGDNLTHLIYAFIRLCGPNQLSRDDIACADKEDHQLAETNSTVDKQFNQYLEAMSQTYPDLIILPSIGGGGGSQGFAAMAVNQGSRAVFVKSVINYLERFPFYGGVDIDWEWPNDITEGENYATLMHDIRDALTVLTETTGKYYQITSAISSSERKVDRVNYASAQQAMDYILLMTYDLYGSWNSTNIGHHSALETHSNNEAEGYNDSGAKGLQRLLDAGVPAEKLVLGVANYGRGWREVVPHASGSPIGGSAGGVFPTPEGSWENGESVYSVIANSYLDDKGQGINGWENIIDQDCQCSYLWHSEDKNLIGYEDPTSILMKGEYVLEHNFGGVFAWEYYHDNGDLLSAMNEGMGNQLGETLVINPPKTSTPYLSGTTYLMGQVVSFDGKLYECKVAAWCTQGGVFAPANSASDSAWTLLGDVIVDGTTWVVSTKYIKGDEVTHSSVTYVARWNHMEKEPGVTNAWKREGEVNTDWSESTAYIKGYEVIHDGVKYIAKWNNKNREPGVTGVWVVADVSVEWVTSDRYVKGNEVIHDGVKYRAKWNNTNKEPGIAGVWVTVAGVDWIASDRYVSGHEVIHHGVKYKAKWNNTNKEPGVAGVWKVNQ
jgi:chitinase